MTRSLRYPKGKRVYVIEILEPWYEVAEELKKEELRPGMRVFYVGKTGLGARARYKQHRRGKKAGAIFRRIRAKRGSVGLRKTLEDGTDTRLRRDLMTETKGGLSEDEALGAEKRLARHLADEGHLVFQN